MRVLIVKLSSLGDVVHAMPVVHDIRSVYSGARIDWVVEPAFAPLVRRVQGIGEVIECAQRRWRKRWWTSAVRAEWREFKRKLTAERYDAVIDLQGLTKSALVARMAQGPSFGLANKTEGSGYEWPVRWLIDQTIEITPRIHALDRSRELAARALNYQVSGSPYFGLLSHAEPLAQPTVVFVHGTSRDDKLWPEECWVELGQRMVASGVAVALPHAGPVELARAERIARAIGPQASVWPQMSLDALVDRLGAAQGVIGVDSGLSHIAVALNLPHVQLYNFPTAWRTGPLAAHGHHHQAALEREPTPEVDLVWATWQVVRRAKRG
ncbi:lipopolysaccharide heptosyltransferase I [Piscinibacter gummiphilus]|uniref:Lipopolysaccharide heptosyltransferase 1 n=1 Tax=Piscinibacter gummiphilus TaxID=946333 RepID=A0ABZ0D5D4_9BURK|nr:lipopolysaccharide heptosyltransferase I [Piscinibacter gummiphilus]WOB10258.1 lipopolysaccharide heptosyltransferase I [Piscinibacter gummiphilus]